MRKITLSFLFSIALCLSGMAQLIFDNTCTTSFDDISTTGVDLLLSDDGEANITIPFVFTLDGVASSDLRVGNNGGVLFGVTTGEVGFSSTPTAPGFYPFSDDIDSDYGSVVWETLGVAPNRRVVVMWNDRPHYSNSPSGATFEIILYETTNEITFLYQDTDFGSGNANNDAVSAGIRIVGANGTYVYSTNTALAGVNCINWSIPSCSQPVATQTVVSDCPSSEFSVDVDVTDLGDSSAITITNSFNADIINVPSTGVYTAGPFPTSATVTLTLNAESNTDCNVSLAPASFTTCPPSNDDCSNAIALTPGNTFGDNVLSGQSQGGSTDSGELPLPSCSVYDPADPTGFGGDVWYAVVVPADGNITIETQGDPAGNGGDSGMSVYSGSCGALVEVDCDDDDSADGFYSLVSISDLSLANQILYIKVFEYGGNDQLFFQISAYSATLVVNEFEDANAFTYFPNPVKNELTVRAQSTIQNVSIYNMLGQEVLRTLPNVIESNIDMNELQTGAYFIKVTIDNVTETIRVIKQ